MVVPFGFSVGDVITGIGAIKHSIEAFSDMRGATQEHKLLSDTLTRLCECLKVIREIELDPVHDAQEREAIEQAVEQCQQCIDAFIGKIAKYEAIKPGAQPQAWGKKVKTAVRKVQWVLCEQKDIAKFKADVQLQFDAISGLLVVLQIHRGRHQACLQDAHRQQDVIYRETLLETRDIVRESSTVLDEQSSTLNSVRVKQTETLDVALSQLNIARNTDNMCQMNQGILNIQQNTLGKLDSRSEQLLNRADLQLSVAENTQDIVCTLQSGMTEEQRSMLQQILQQQTQNFQLMLLQQAQNFQLSFMQQAQNHHVLISNLNAISGQLRLQNEIPPQVLLQQPMIFRDALDRVTPVHLEFIDSAEAFMAVLKVRFRDIGLHKLERKEFLLSDEKQNRDIDLQRPWHVIMKPGQYVAMSMVFNASIQQNTCPGCSSENAAQEDKQTVCNNCGLTYRLVEEMSMLDVFPGLKAFKEQHINRMYHPCGLKSFRTSQDTVSTRVLTIADFRRVHLISRGTPTVTYVCQFDFIDCGLQFPPIEFCNWYAHSLTHFLGGPLPTYTRCIFCSQVFENDDAMISWRQRMCHIAAHFDEGFTIDQSMPDWPLLKHMFKHGIIKTDYHEILDTRGSERHHLDRFQRHDYIPGSIGDKMGMQQEREYRAIIREPRRIRQRIPRKIVTILSYQHEQQHEQRAWSEEQATTPTFTRSFQNTSSSTHTTSPKASRPRTHVTYPPSPSLRKPGGVH